MNGTTPEMTVASKPRRNPPIATVIATKAMLSLPPSPAAGLTRFYSRRPHGWSTWHSHDITTAWRANPDQRTSARTLAELRARVGRRRSSEPSEPPCDSYRQLDSEWSRASDTRNAQSAHRRTRRSTTAPESSALDREPPPSHQQPYRRSRTPPLRNSLRLRAGD